MTIINTTGTKTAKELDLLKYQSTPKGLSFSGTTLPTTLEVGFVNDAGTFIPFIGGVITVLSPPTNFVVDVIPPQGIALNVSGGSPNFVVDAF